MTRRTVSVGHPQRGRAISCSSVFSVWVRRARISAVRSYLAPASQWVQEKRSMIRAIASRLSMAWLLRGALGAKTIDIGLKLSLARRGHGVSPDGVFHRGRLPRLVADLRVHIRAASPAGVTHPTAIAPALIGPVVDADFRLVIAEDAQDSVP